jgi:hypothetical protein
MSAATSIRAAADPRAEFQALLELELERLRLVVRRRMMWLRARWGSDPLASHVALVVSDERADGLAGGEDRDAERAFFHDHEPAAALTAEIEGVEDELRARGGVLAEAGVPGPLDRLAARLGFGSLERGALLVALAPELDAAFERLYAYLQDDATRSFATPQLVLDLLAPRDREAARDALAPGATLRRLGLVELGGGNEAAWGGRPLRVPERVVDHLRGGGSLDERVARVVRPLVPLELPPVLSELAEAVARHAAGAAARGLWPVPCLMGGVESGRREVAATACALLGLVPYALEAAAAADVSGAVLDREAALMRLGYVVEGEQAVLLAGELAAPVFLLSEGRLELKRDSIAIEVPPLDAPSRTDMWRRALGRRRGAGKAAARLGASFELGPTSIAEVVAEADARARLASGDPAALAGPEELALACRERARFRSAGLAERIAPTATWEDIVLPPPLQCQLEELRAQAGNRARVYDEWGFGRSLARGRGITALFSGPSGTGKTMAAEVLADDLTLDLYRIDLAGVVSKFIGETEKNLRRVFDSAEHSGAILFFDEADALFGKRTEVRDSHDRYANIEVDYLLQRMESYGGLAILATNRRGLLDPAFLRRLRFVLDFPFPSAADRRRMWERAFPPSTPVGELDLDALAGLELSGGSIRNVALNAAFLAAADGGRVEMEHVLRAGRREYMKLDRLVTESDFGAAAKEPL